MKFNFELARKEMLDDIYNLFLKRIDWMNEKGIKQWNVTNYTESYPKEYFKNQIEQNNIYVGILNGQILGAIVVFEEDSRWEKDPMYPSYYIHNFVTDPKVKGVGVKLLQYVEEMAKGKGKTRCRLDCAEDNIFLNNYYEKAGYHFVGKCVDGDYKGNKREKIIL